MGLLDIIHTVASFLPEVKSPDKPLGVQQKIFWTGAALLLYFILYETTAFGVLSSSVNIDFIQTITASRQGSLLTTGIGPIVLASIFLQLFVGAGILNIKMQDRKDRAKFLEAQKVLAIILAFIEAMIFVVFIKLIAVTPIPGLSTELVMALVVLQITLGSIFVLYMDELVTKYGIGSGISLFIAAGVSLQVVVGLVQLLFGAGGFVAIMGEGGAEALPNALISVLPFAFTLLVFLVVVYAESMKVEIPIAFERVRGMVPNLPLKFFYVSNIPVIFASALIINAQLFSGGLLTGQYWKSDQSGQSAETYSDMLSNGYSFEKHGILPLIGYTDPSGRLRDGLLYFVTSPVSGLGQSTSAHFNTLVSAKTPIFLVPEWVHAIIYIISLSLISILFGLFWVETSNMDAKSVANQLSTSGIQIPGFRRDPRMIETILNKHILPLTVMGSFCVGLLAGLADLTGALGTGTGILLTVGILHQLYEKFEQENMFGMYPSLGKFFTE